MVGHLASPKPLHMARWGGKGALMGCTRRKTGPTGTLPLPTEDHTHTHGHPHSITPVSAKIGEIIAGTRSMGNYCAKLTIGRSLIAVTVGRRWCMGAQGGAWSVPLSSSPSGCNLGPTLCYLFSENPGPCLATNFSMNSRVRWRPC